MQIMLLENVPHLWLLSAETIDFTQASVKGFKPKFVIPMHYGTTPVLKGTPQEYLAALGQTPTKVFVMNPGDKIEF